jgi:hypothetical protein
MHDPRHSAKDALPTPVKNRRRPGWLAAMVCVCALVLVRPAHAAGDDKVSAAENTQASVISARPLDVDQVVRNLEDRNRERAEALRQFQGTRVYTMQYRGVPHNYDADMVVTMTFHAPGQKDFSVISQSGSKVIINHVFKKLLEGELEAAGEENRRQIALSHDNYDFKLLGHENGALSGNYVLEVFPKQKNKFLYCGKVWVDDKDFAVTRIDAEPARNPSFWIKKTEIHHKYVKIGNFWFPAENRTESDMRLGGNALLSIDYKDYKITDALPLQSH